jgi:hypothetical protein
MMQGQEPELQEMSQNKQHLIGFCVVMFIFILWIYAPQYIEHRRREEAYFTVIRSMHEHKVQYGDIARPDPKLVGHQWQSLITGLVCGTTVPEDDGEWGFNQLGTDIQSVEFDTEAEAEAFGKQWCQP